MAINYNIMTSIRVVGMMARQIYEMILILGKH